MFRALLPYLAQHILERQTRQHHRDTRAHSKHHMQRPNNTYAYLNFPPLVIVEL